MTDICQRDGVARARELSMEHGRAARLWVRVHFRLQRVAR